MTHSPLDALEAVFAAIVEDMPPEFNSHHFILRLAHRHQRLYVDVLTLYSNTDQPFQIAHGQIANRLLKHTDLVVKIGERTSKNIFGESQRAAVWRRVQ